MKRILTFAFYICAICAVTAQNNVGIGTSAPDDLLHIKGGDMRIEHGSFPKVKLYKGINEAAALEINGGNLWLTNKLIGNVYLRTQNMPRLTIAYSGDIGIGTTAPNDLLHIQDGDMRLQGDGVFFNLHAMDSTAFHGLRFHDAGGFRGAWFYYPGTNRLNLTNSVANTGLVMDFGTNNVGIGAEDPAAKLHVAGGNMRLEGENNFFDIHAMDPSTYHGIRFHDEGGFRGGMFYHPTGNSVNITKSTGLGGMVVDFANNFIGVGTGQPEQRLDVFGKISIGDDVTSPSEGTMRYNSSTNTFEGYDGSTWLEFGGGSGHWSATGSTVYYNDGPVLVGRTNTIGSERFGVRIPVTGPNYGGMYIETNGDSGGRPFYGYAIDGAAKMWHYYDGTSGDWRLYNAGDKLTVENSGEVGIGTIDPEAPLHVVSKNNWDLSSTEGDLKIGANDYRLVMGVATGGVGAGTARIYAKGGDQKLIFGGGTTDAMSVLPNGRVGIGLNTPLHALHVYRQNSSYNVMFESDNGSPDLVLDHSAASTDNSTITFQAEGGFQGSIGYDPDDEYLFMYEGGNILIGQNGRLGVGIVPNVNYKLSVDGKIIGEEVKVQLSQQWPDYVFDETYALPTLDELKAHISQEGHLPGVPSAREVEISEGFNLGEMNRILLEKVEELTLYILQQEERIKHLEGEIDAMKTRDNE